MVDAKTGFFFEELWEFDITQLRRICGYYNLPYEKKTSKKRLIDTIWKHTKPPSKYAGSLDVSPEVLGDPEHPISVKLARMQAQALIEGDIPNEW